MDKNAKIALVVQARLGSTRLKNKMFQVLGGYTIFEWVLLRVRKTRGVSDFVLATTEDRQDDQLCLIAEELGFSVFRGPTHDVLTRFVSAVEGLNSNAAIRVCADNPFVDNVSLRRLIDCFHRQSGVDLIFNHRPFLDCDYPDGFGAELIRSETLFKLLGLVETNVHREHLTSYLYENLSSFKLLGLKAPQVLRAPNLKFDVDTPKDLELLNRFVQRSGISISSSAESIVEAAMALSYPNIRKL